MFNQVINQRNTFNFDIAKNLKHSIKDQNKFDMHFKMMDPLISAKYTAEQALEHLKKDYNFDKILQPYKKNNSHVKEVKQKMSLEQIDLIGSNQFD